MAAADKRRVDSLLPGTAGGIELEYPARLVPPPAWIGHIPFAFWLISALKPRMVVELGVHTGNSYCAFLQAVHTLGLETRCFGVDHWQGDEHAGHSGDEIYQDLKAYHDPLYGTFSTLLRSPFEEALPYFSDGSVDLLHIDGFPTYEVVSADFKSWLPKISSRGVALFPNINVRERGFGIWQFWEELTERYPHFEFLHSHGLGIVYLGTESLTGPAKALFAEKAAGERERIQSYFSRLGISVVERLTIQTLAPTATTEAGLTLEKSDRKKGRVALLERELSSAKSNLEEAMRNLQAAKLQAQIKTSMTHQRLAVTARLQRELITANREKDSWHAETARLHQELHAADLEKNSLHAETARLHQDLHVANLERNSLHAEAARLQQELHAANLDRNSLHGETVRLHQELHAAELERNSLHAETARLQQELHAANLDRNSLHGETVRLHQEMHAADLERNSLQADKVRLQQELHAAELEESFLLAEKARLQQEVLATSLENTRRQRRVFTANLQRDSSHVEAVRLQQELLKITLERNSYLWQLNEALQSRSWRITKPLRWVNAGLSRLLHRDPQPDNGSNTAVTKF